MSGNLPKQGIGLCYFICVSAVGFSVFDICLSYSNAGGVGELHFEARFRNPLHQDCLLSGKSEYFG
jgi:hypothetical protein